MLDNLLISKITTNEVNADQISFIINLMHGYDKDDFFDERTEMSVKKRQILEKQNFNKSKQNFLNSKTNTSK